MKHQQVSVDYWAMGKAMITYGALTLLVWVMLRLISAVFTLPRRLRAQQANMESTLKELQRRYPALNITEEDMKNAEKDLEELTKDSNYFDKMDKIGEGEKMESLEKPTVEENSNEAAGNDDDKKTK